MKILINRKLKSLILILDSKIKFYKKNMIKMIILDKEW